MGAQPDTLTSTREVWHGVPQILAQVSVAAHLATYLAARTLSLQGCAARGGLRRETPVQRSSHWHRGSHRRRMVSSGREDQLYACPFSSSPRPIADLGGEDGVRPVGTPPCRTVTC